MLVAAWTFAFFLLAALGQLCLALTRQAGKPIGVFFPMSFALVSLLLFISLVFILLRWALRLLIKPHFYAPPINPFRPD